MCCCCVYQALEGWQGSKGEMAVLLSCGLHQEEQASASSSFSLPLPSLGLHSQSSAVSWEMGIHGILGWVGDCALQSLSCRLGHSVQSSCATEYCREPSTFKRKGCSLAPPWLFLIFIFCQLLEVHKMSILRALLSCDRP